MYIKIIKKVCLKENDGQQHVKRSDEKKNDSQILKMKLYIYNILCDGEYFK